jgi:hypothetical protein
MYQKWLRSIMLCRHDNGFIIVDISHGIYTIDILEFHQNKWRTEKMTDQELRDYINKNFMYMAAK